MADSYLYLNNGVLTNRELTVTSAGAGNSGDGVALDASGKLDNSLMPTGIGPDTQTVEASENLSAGDFVNLWYDVDTLKARKADASTTGKEAKGFVLSAVTSGNDATVYRHGENNQLSGLTPGTMYYLSDTVAGDITATPPTSGILQPPGGWVATSATSVFYTTQAYVVL